MRESVAGRLVERISRLDDQGRIVDSIVRNISGSGTFRFSGDGVTLTARGNWVFFVEPGGLIDGPPALDDGLVWLTTGRWVWEYTDDGVRLVSHAGRYEDVCALLA